MRAEPSHNETACAVYRELQALNCGAPASHQWLQRQIDSTTRWSCANGRFAHIWDVRRRAANFRIWPPAACRSSP